MVRATFFKFFNSYDSFVSALQYKGVIPQIKFDFVNVLLKKAFKAYSWTIITSLVTIFWNATFSLMTFLSVNNYFLKGAVSFLNHKYNLKLAKNSLRNQKLNFWDQY